ncbi:PAS domain S-box protein [Flavobacterium sp. N3904]|uniref:PAS domain S-box protein n=1 Tax=Flavobacterium sp. N3904 TaxID=2986835 RepID=UPI0022250082|nr:PAS domain S-box protein [Flavobacterium sp. N3904]
MEFTKKWLKLIRWSLINPRTAGFFIFLFLSSGIVFSIFQRIQIIKENEHREMEIALEAVKQNVNQCLKNCYTTTLTLALTINDKGIPENFDSISSQLLASNDCLDAVQLVPNGVIKYIYPLKGNESALNLNLFNTPNVSKEAIQSITNKSMYFAGPLILKQGGLGIIGRLPVYKKNKFWGFAAVVIKLNTLLKISGVNSIDTNKYYFQFSKINPNTKKEEFFLPFRDDFQQAQQISTKMPDGNWKLYLTRLKGNHEYSSLIIPSILSIILCLLFGAFITILLNKPKRLEELITIQAEKLLNSELKFKTIFDRAPIGIALVDNNTGTFLEINNKFCQLLEYSEKEMKLINYQLITHPQDLIINELNAKNLNEGIINEYTLKKRYITKTGKKVWVNLNVTSLLNTGEKRNTNIAIVEDITLQKQILENLRKSEAQFRNLFKESPIPLWEVDLSYIKNYLKNLKLIDKDPKIVENYIKEHPEVVLKCFSLIKIVALNNKCLELLNIKAKEELTNNLEQVLDKETINDFIKQLVAITQNNLELIYDSQIKNSNGDSIDIHFRWNVIRGYEKTFERIIISTEDITSRKLNEKVILNSQQKIESIVNTIDGIVWECDITTFAFTFVSKKVKQILGYTPEEWIDEPNFWENHIHPDDRVAAMEYCSAKTKELLNHDLEYRMICKNGSAIWIRDMVNIVYENDKAVSLHGIMIDITKSKNIEADLNNSFNLVTKQNERLLNFSYIISHNLRSHTSNIASIVALIMSAETKEERADLMKLLVSVSNLLNETMLHLNEVINIRTNISISTEDLSLKEYADNVMKVFSQQIISKKVTISNQIPEDLIIHYNPAYLESVLYNMISNAIKYNHPERKLCIDLKWITKKDKKYLEISDNGIGIDLVKNGKKIFGMYKTFSNNPNSKGVGLFITKNQIEAMGGTITVESEPNIGTTFKIEIL